MRWIITILPDAGTHSGIVEKSPFMARRIRSPRHGARYVFSMRAISLGASAPLWRRCDGRTEPVAASMRRSGGTARTAVQISAGCRGSAAFSPWRIVREKRRDVPPFVHSSGNGSRAVEWADGMKRKQVPEEQIIGIPKEAGVRQAIYGKTKLHVRRCRYIRDYCECHAGLVIPVSVLTPVHHF